MSTVNRSDYKWSLAEWIENKKKAVWDSSTQLILRRQFKWLKLLFVYSNAWIFIKITQNITVSGNICFLFAFIWLWWLHVKCSRYASTCFIVLWVFFFRFCFIVNHEMTQFYIYKYVTGKANTKDNWQLHASDKI